MKNKLKFLFSAVIACLVLFAGCTPKMTVHNMLINGEYIPVKTLFTVGSYDVSLFEYKYYYEYYKLNKDLGKDSYWDEHKDEIGEVKELALEDIKLFYATLMLADELQLELTKEQKKDIDTMVSNLIASYGSRDDFNAAMLESGLDEALFRKMAEKDEYESLIYDCYFGKNGTNKFTFDEVSSYAKENFARYKQIYMRLDYDGTTTNKDLMESIVEQLKNGESFDTLMKKYSRDPDVSSYPDGYYVHNESESFQKEYVFALEENSLSEIVVDDGGYYLFIRLPMGDDVSKNIDNFRAEMETEFYLNKLDETMAKQDIKFTEYYDKISFESVLYD